MKKLLLASCLTLAFGVVAADELADAAKLLENKDYARAVQLYTKLAESGNIEAQLQLGDIYGFGDGAPENPQQATFWLNKAAASGNKDALATLQALQERSKRKAEILYYTDNYDGADVKLEKFKCVEPEIPQSSVEKKKILAVNNDVTAWFKCYDLFTENMNKSLPPGKAIPSSVIDIMSRSEFARASSAMDKQYAIIGADAQKKAQSIRTKYDAWRDATEIAVVQAKKQLEETERQNRANRIAAGETNDLGRSNGGSGRR